MCFRTKFRRCRSNSFGVGWAQRFGGRPAPLGRGRSDPVETRPCHTCLIIPNFVALCQTVWHVRRAPKNLATVGPAPLEYGAWSPHRSMLFCHLFYRANCGHFRTNHTSVIYGDPPKMTLASRLTRSLDVIGTETDPSATYDFLLVFRSNCCRGIII